MSIATLPANDVFRTEPIRGLPEGARVDLEKRKIFGAKAMQFGPLNAGDARPWKVDQVTLEQLVTLTNQRNGGTKMRFAHPNMSSDGMGKHVGRSSNAKIVGTGEDAFVSVDCDISTTNKIHGDYVLNMANDYPEDFGLSIAPLLDRAAMDKCTPDAAGLVPIRLKGLRAIDFVDEPAATRGGLFELNSDSLADLPAQATDLLDRFFADSPAEVIRERFGNFLTTYLTNRGDSMSTSNPAPAPTPVPAPTPAPVAAPTPVANLSTEDLAKQQAREELERRSQITALCTLAKINDADRELMINAGFSRAEAQEYLKSSGRLSAANPPLSEGGTDLGGKKETPDENFGAEYDANSDIFVRQGLSRFDYINSRRIDEKLIPHLKPKAS